MTIVRQVDIAQLTPADVMSVYSGTAYKCCCGCSGNHRYNSKHVEAATLRRGYAVSKDEVNDRQISRVLNIIKDCAASGSKVERQRDEQILTVEQDGRWYIAYLVN